MATPSDVSTAQIFDQGYKPWRGELASVRSRFLVIAANELRMAWKEKRFRQIVFVSFLPTLVLGVLVVLGGSVAAGMKMEIWSIFWGVQAFLSMLVVFYVGRNAIGEDLRSGALTIYFSRPVSFNQYLAGKWLAISLGVLGVTTLPGVVLATLRWLVETDVSFLQFLLWLAVLLVLGSLWAGTTGAVMLALSALAGRGRAAGIAWVLLFFSLSGIANGLAHGTGVASLKALSFLEASSQLVGVFLGSQAWGMAGFWCLVGLLAWMVVSVGVVLLRLRKWIRS